MPRVTEVATIASRLRVVAAPFEVGLLNSGVGIAEIEVDEFARVGTAGIEVDEFAPGDSSRFCTLLTNVVGRGVQAAVEGP